MVTQPRNLGRILVSQAAAWGRALSLRDTEEILRQFEHYLRRELTPEEKHMLRLSYAAYPESECRARDEERPEPKVKQAG
jgi:hypothetical protein